MYLIAICIFRCWVRVVLCAYVRRHTDWQDSICSNRACPTWGIAKENFMNPIRTIAIVLVVAGALALLYGGFSYTKDTTVVKLGPIELTAKEQKNVNVPVWAGLGALVVGGLMLVMGGKKG